jgi:hypothetical protein
MLEGINAKTSSYIVGLDLEKITPTAVAEC